MTRWRIAVVVETLSSVSFILFDKDFVMEIRTGTAIHGGGGETQREPSRKAHTHNPSSYLSIYIYIYN